MPRIVIIDTSSLILFQKINELGILKNVYNDLILLLFFMKMQFISDEDWFKYKKTPSFRDDKIEGPVAQGNRCFPDTRTAPGQAE